MITSIQVHIERDEAIERRRPGYLDFTPKEWKIAMKYLADDKKAEDERLAAERIGDLMGFTDEPLCLFCGGDTHVRPDCPVRIEQEERERKRAEERLAYDVRMGYRSKRRTRK